jgi:hypothetical protein
MVQLDVHPVTQAVADPFAEQALDALIREARRRTRRRRGFRAGIAVALIGLGFGVIAAVSGGGGHGTSPSPSRRAGPGQVPFGTCTGCGPGASATSLARGHWVTYPRGPLQPRVGQVGLWTGSRMLVWGGAAYNASYRNGATFDPLTDQWELLPRGPLAGRSGTAAVWTGQEALIWGGATRSTSAGQSVDLLASGGASYDPSTRQWRRIPQAPIASRQGPLAFWTGRQMIVFGGRRTSLHLLLSGATYSPTTGKWAKIPAFPRRGVRGFAGSISATWTGHQLIVWATLVQVGPCGPNCARIAPHLVEAEWTPGSTTWRRLADPPWDALTNGAVPVWTGTHVVLLHGNTCPPAAGASCAYSPDPQDGRVYPPNSETSTTTPTTKVLAGYGPSLWTGRSLLVVNAESNGAGAAYDPSRRRWIDLPRAPITDFEVPTDVWTGTSFIVWGQGEPSNLGEMLVAKE